LDLHDQIEAELALCRGAVCAIAALTAAALAAPPVTARRRHRLRAAAIAGAAMAALAIGCGAGAAAAAFHAPSRVLNGISYHHRHGRKRPDVTCSGPRCLPPGPFWVP
jgi:hypothetical protein